MYTTTTTTTTLLTLLTLSTAALALPTSSSSQLQARSSTYTIANRSFTMVKTTDDGNAISDFVFDVSSADLGIDSLRCTYQADGGCGQFVTFENYPCASTAEGETPFSFSFYLGDAGEYGSTGYVFDVIGPDGTASEAFPLSAFVANRGATVGQSCASLAAESDEDLATA